MEQIEAIATIIDKIDARETEDCSQAKETACSCSCGVVYQLMSDLTVTSHPAAVPEQRVPWGQRARVLLSSATKGGLATALPAGTGRAQRAG